MKSVIRVGAVVACLFMGLEVLAAETREMSAEFATTRTEPRVHVSAGETYRYRLHAPKKIEPGRKYPLVVYMHGMAQRGTNNVDQVSHCVGEILDAAEKAGVELFLVAGQVPPKERWARFGKGAVPTTTMRLQFELLDKLVAEAPVDPARIYVTGQSMGGIGTWDAIGRRPDFFAAALPIASSPPDLSLATKLVKLPIWCIHGTKDNCVKPERAREICAAIKAAGGKLVRHTELEGVGHRSDIPAYRDPAVYRWLFSQHR